MKCARVVTVLQSIILVHYFDESLGIRHNGIFKDMNIVRHTFVEPSQLHDFNKHGAAVEEKKPMVCCKLY
jgi:hypothetical protein